MHAHTYSLIHPIAFQVPDTVQSTKNKHSSEPSEIWFLVSWSLESTARVRPSVKSHTDKYNTIHGDTALKERYARGGNLFLQMKIYIIFNDSLFEVTNCIIFHRVDVASLI